MADVGEDIFGILNTYLTSRQGPNDGKPQPPQPPPAPPAGMAPNVAQPPNLPPPEPGQVTPPTPSSERTLAADGGLSQFMAIQKAAMEAQRKAQLGSSLAHAGASIGAALTRSPSMRESLTTIAGQKGGAGGAGTGDGVGNLSAESFLGFQKRADTIQERARFAQTRGQLSKQLGISEAALQTMYDTDPKKIADIQAQHANPDREVKVLDDGTIISTRKNAAPGEQPLVLGIDTEKVAEGKRKDIKLGLEGEKQRIDTAKEGRDVQKFATEESVRLSSDASISELSRLIDKPEAVLRSMTQEQRAKLITEQLHPQEPTAEQKTLANINRERTKQGLGTYTEEQWRGMENAKTQELERIKAGFGPQATSATSANEKTDEANKALLQAHQSREQARNALFRGGQVGIYAGGGPVTEWAVKYQKFMQGLTGQPNPKISNTEIYTASLASDVLNTVKGLGAGTSISDADRKFAEQAAGGNTELNQESMRRLLAIRDKLDRQKLEANNQSIDRRYNALPGLARIVEPVALPKQDKEMLRYTDNADLLNAIENPDQNKDFFESTHGKGSHAEYQNRMDELIQSKMATLNDKTKTWSNEDKQQFNDFKEMPAEYMEANKARLEADAIKKYGPDQGTGLIDVVLAAKKAGKF